MPSESTVFNDPDLILTQTRRKGNQGGSASGRKMPTVTQAATARINLSATAPPAVTDDADSGYSILSQILDTTGPDLWVCVDATPGAAVWKKVTP